MNASGIEATVLKLDIRERGMGRDEGESGVFGFIAWRGLQFLFQFLCLGGMQVELHSYIFLVGQLNDVVRTMVLDMKL
jgi:hypothetical protein